MTKKIVIVIAVLAVAMAFSINALSRKAPSLLRQAIEEALNKNVVIGAIEYHFPWTFELQGFKVKERGRFEGDASFSADRIRLNVSPISLSKKMLVIDKLEVEDAEIVLRMAGGKLTHALSNAMKKAAPAAREGGPAEKARPAGMPLRIRQFLIKNSHFKFIDYDAQEEGFVIVFDRINAEIKNINLPFSSTRTSYRVRSIMPQGRDQRAAEVDLVGWTVFSTLDSDANLRAHGIYLPYFKPYYGQVTAASIGDGYLDSRANLRLEKNDLVLNVDLEIIGLLFQAYESENQLFGLKAEEILSFLKDQSGRLKFQFVARWNIADRSVRARDVVRKSIERSLKSTILGNVGNILQNTLQKVNDQGFEKSKDDIKGTIDKIKELFKY